MNLDNFYKFLSNQNCPQITIKFIYLPELPWSIDQDRRAQDRPKYMLTSAALYWFSRIFPKDLSNWIQTPKIAFEARFFFHPVPFLPRDAGLQAADLVTWWSSLSQPTVQGRGSRYLRPGLGALLGIWVSDSAAWEPSAILTGEMPTPSCRLR